MGEPGHRRRKRLLVASLSLAASTTLGELAVRAWLGAPLAERLPLMVVRANPYRGWEMVPCRTHYTYHHRVEVNSLGLRGPELGPSSRGERRILFLGDSLTYGQGVGDLETVPAALEHALRECDSGHPWTVVNAGHRAYGTAQELGLLEELGERVGPEVVVLGWYWNDVSERDVRATYESFRELGEFVFDTGDRLEGLERVLWYAQEYPRRSALVMLAHDLFVPKGRLYSPEVHEQGMQRLSGLLARFRETCMRLGAAPVMAVFPDRHRLEGSEATRPFEERAAALGRERELLVVELLPALVPLHAARGRLPVLPFDGHYDAEANRAMGAYLAERLLALGVPERAE
jgi:hypothetical protein